MTSERLEARMRRAMEHLTALRFELLTAASDIAECIGDDDEMVDSFGKEFVMLGGQVVSVETDIVDAFYKALETGGTQSDIL